MPRPLTAFALAIAISSGVQQGGAQAPSGLAASAFVAPGFDWLHRTTPGFRVYFLADSYPSRHQDSLLHRLPAAARNAETLLGVESPQGPIDLFFIESREQMTQLIGGRATGFAQPSTRTVLLVTNPAWRAFERHEIMHVIAGQAWGAAAPNTDWLVEGLAQAADGRCGNYSNAEVVRGLAARQGWIPLSTMLNNFRAQPDLRAYLQAAAFVDHLLQRFGPALLKEIWTKGATPETMLAGHPLSTLEQEWRAGLPDTAGPGESELASIEDKGCG